MPGMINGKKAVKALQTAKGLLQKEVGAIEGINENHIAARLKNGFYDKPGNYARLVDNLGLVLDVQIKAVVKDQDGNVLFDVPINVDFMEEE